MKWLMRQPADLRVCNAPPPISFSQAWTWPPRAAKCKGVSHCSVLECTSSGFIFRTTSIVLTKPWNEQTWRTFHPRLVSGMPGLAPFASSNWTEGNCPILAAWCRGSLPCSSGMFGAAHALVATWHSLVYSLLWHNARVGMDRILRVNWH